MFYCKTTVYYSLAELGKMHKEGYAEAIGDNFQKMWGDEPAEQKPYTISDLDRKVFEVYRRQMDAGQALWYDFEEEEKAAQNDDKVTTEVIQVKDESNATLKEKNGTHLSPFLNVIDDQKFSRLLARL